MGTICDAKSHLGGRTAQLPIEVCNRAGSVVAVPAMLGVLLHNIITNKHNIIINKHNFIINKHNFITNKHNIITNKHNIITNKHNKLTSCFSQPENRIKIKHAIQLCTLAYTCVREHLLPTRKSWQHIRWQPAKYKLRRHAGVRAARQNTAAGVAAAIPLLLCCRVNRM
ncbi:hypothetical protein FHG87_019972 [Trinorchestia longiramus]|nr:hypothetical protein FHG87_019972 [Trinorchestia longiramus]